MASLRAGLQWASGSAHGPGPSELGHLGALGTEGISLGLGGSSRYAQLVLLGTNPRTRGRGVSPVPRLGAQSGPPTLRGLRVDPRPSCAQSGPPTPRGFRVDPHPHVLSVGPPHPVDSVGPPLGSVWPRAWRSAAPWAAWCGARLLRVSQLVSGRVTVLVLTCGLFCVCTCVLAASAFSVSFGSDTRYSSFLFRARWPALSGFQSPLPLPVRPPVPLLSSPPPCGSAS